MSELWPEVELGDVLTLKRGYDLPNKERREGTVPIVSSSGISGHHNEAKVNGPGVITGRYGTLGEVFLVNEPYWPLNTTLYVQNFKGNDPAFISYFLRTLNLASQNAAGAVPGLNRNALHMLKVRVPPILLQRKIASILSAYDDLIENNARRVQVLEDMARALYREWFVEYRYPGHEQASIDEDALAHRPSEWQLLEIRDVAPVITRGIAPKYDDDSDNWVINQKCIRDQKLNLLPARRHRSKVPPVKLLRFGDVLINSTGVGTLGRVAQVYQEPVDLSVDTHVTIVRPDQDKVQLDYFGLALMSLQTDFEAAGVGSTGQTELGRERIATTQIIIPPLNIQAEFGQRIRPARQLVQQLLERNTNLRRTRDLLLPKLVSGELDVSTLDVQGAEEQLQEETA